MDFLTTLRGVMCKEALRRQKMHREWSYGRALREVKADCSVVYDALLITSRRKKGGDSTHEEQQVNP